jgi:hypothetical protein
VDTLALATKLGELKDLKTDQSNPKSSKDGISKIIADILALSLVDPKEQQVSFPIPVFCYRNGISLSLYHKLKNKGLGPTEMRLGAIIRISAEAELEWKRARSNPVGAEAQAKAQAQDIATERGRRAGTLAVQSPFHVANIRRAKRSQQGA